MTDSTEYARFAAWATGRTVTLDDGERVRLETSRNGDLKGVYLTGEHAGWSTDLGDWTDAGMLRLCRKWEATK